VVGPATETGKRRSILRVVAWSVALLAGLVVTHLLDKPAYRLTGAGSIETAGTWMVRSVGFLPFWLFVAAALLLIDARRYAGQHLRRITRRAELIFWPTLLAGIVVGILKIVIRRERPLYHDAEYVFRDWSPDTFEGGGLGMPSGDLAVVSAAAFVLARMYPAATPVWAGMVLASAACRVGGGAHFLSDAYAGAVLGGLLGLLAWTLNRRTMQRVDAAESEL
jgi:membrane-associated phospholipid phosphatase